MQENTIVIFLRHITEIMQSKRRIILCITHIRRAGLVPQVSILTSKTALFATWVFGGCNGNLKGIGKLVEGMKLEDVVDKLKNTTCGSRSTSCPDQLARACESVLEGKI